MKLGEFNGISENFAKKPTLYLDACGCCMWSKPLEEISVEDLQDVLSEIEKQKAFVVKELEGRQNNGT